MVAQLVRDVAGDAVVIASARETVFEDPEQAHVPAFRSSGLEDARDRARQLPPARRLGLELPSPTPGQLIEARAAVVVGDAPGRRNPAALLHAVERGVQGPLLD